MDHPVEYSLQDFDTAYKPMFRNNFEEGSSYVSKTRNIPVHKMFDSLKVPGVFYENVSGVKELKKPDNVMRRSDSPVSQYSPVSALSSKTLRTPKNRSKVDLDIDIKALQKDDYSDHCCFDRMAQGSLSEPALPVDNDRGDNVTLQDILTEGSALGNIHAGDANSLLSNSGAVKGCIYIKNAKKIYKSTIEAKSLKMEDNSIINNVFKKKTSKLLGSSFSKNKLNDKWFRNNGFNFSTEENGDFEIAIFLSGLNSSSVRKQRDKNLLDSKSKRDIIRIQQQRLQKKKRRGILKNDATVGKSCDTLHQRYQNSPRRQAKEHQQDTIRSSRSDTPLNYQMKMNLSSESDSDNEFSENEKMSKWSVRKVDNSPGILRGSMRLNVGGYQGDKLSYKSKKSYNFSNRSRTASHSTVSGYSDTYGLTKLKISDEELWELFEGIFRKYASTSRHSGEVIPRKISTTWMTNAGVVDDIITEKEANDAFRAAVGAKITMNAQEYKEFLIMLTLRMKLPYYEIYRRMCGM